MNDTSTHRAGRFDGRPANGSWAWRGDELYDEHGVMIADVRAEVLRADRHRLLLERSPERMSFGLRGTAVDGTVYLLTQSSFTVAHLEADCQGRRYVLTRHKPWRKERIITDLASGDRVARVRPRFDGTVELHDGSGLGNVNLLDVAFMSFGCKLVDSPGHNLRI
ncbi:hypothetical protein [Corynebacterium guangdongense]|uniref:Uncharacterized protein n=1 Tax=Corynebacterium guangdongense TaxID=1783348 RepID=A0ABU1ZYX4_9CORY|nr:hypothetical protein [Corynebacterium guangdongense]MDR7329960.1 hypothetical protein [Corynebacterium guangdongense]WJZ18518.1 hypothetical protein CGUA_09820 [Corynebacterium guangdongense]